MRARKRGPHRGQGPATGNRPQAVSLGSTLFCLSLIPGARSARASTMRIPACTMRRSGMIPRARRLTMRMKTMRRCIPQMRRQLAGARCISLKMDILRMMRMSSLPLCHRYAREEDTFDGIDIFGTCISYHSINLSTVYNLSFFFGPLSFCFRFSFDIDFWQV